MDIKEIGFGDFCTIEQKRYVGPNEFYGYKVVGLKKSNVWTDVPVDANNEKETLHDHLDDVVTVVCNNLDDRTVHQFRVRDLASVKKAQAVPESNALLSASLDAIQKLGSGDFVLVPKEPSADLVNHGHQVFLGHFNECGQTGGRSLYFAYKAMIEAQEQKA